MDVQPNFEYLCRVCAANTKGKNTTVAECVFILKTPGLRDKIERHLYLTISEHDVLPKVLCKTCFRQVEATASLSKIAKHTQKVFRDFLFTTSRPKPPTEMASHQPENVPMEFTPIRLSAPPPEPERSPAAAVAATGSPPPLIAVNSRKDEVVVNVSVNDPLTRETQEKMISASQKRQNSLDARYAAPTSIAQRAFISSGSPKPAEFNNNTNNNSGGATPTAAHSSGGTGGKKTSPPGVINFIHGQPQQMTAQASGGYNAAAAASTNGSSSGGGKTLRPTTSQEVIQQKRRNLKMALNNIKATHSGQVSLLKVSQQRQRARDLRRCVAMHSHKGGVVRAPQKAYGGDDDEYDEEETEELPQQIIIAAAKSKKREREREKPPSAFTTQPARAETPPQQQPQQMSPPQLKTNIGIPDDISLGKVIKDIDLLKLILKALQWPVTRQTMDAQMQRLRNSKFTDIMSDANLLQDTDLTQLLGPYLAPVMMVAHYFQQQQQQQLAAAAAVLAQQPLAAEAVAAAADKEAQSPAAMLSNAIPYKLPPETSVQLVPASPPQAGSAEEEPPVKPPAAPRRTLPPKKLRKVTTPHRVRDPAAAAVVILSDEENSLLLRPSSLAANFKIDIDPSFISPFAIGSGAGDSTSEALLTLLNHQREVISRQQRLQRRRQSSALMVPAELDDIVLMEPSYDSSSLSQKTSTSTLSSAEGAISARRYSATGTPGFPLLASTLPPPQELAAPAITRPIIKQELAAPLITRPIIKRRKTVIQTLPAARANSVATNTVATGVETKATATAPKIAVAVATSTKSLAPPPPPPAAAASNAAPSRSSSPEPAVSPSVHTTTVSTQVPSATNTQTTQMPSVMLLEVKQVPSTTNCECTPPPPPAPPAPEKTSETTTEPPTQPAPPPPPPPPATTKTVAKKPPKSALGQQLLEAIGLQKVPHSTRAQAESSSTRDSVQQIRSALKRQLREAQEQKQKQQLAEERAAAQQKRMPVIQDADSTTKSVVKELHIEGRAKSATRGDVVIDVDDEIDQVALQEPNATDKDDAYNAEDDEPLAKTLGVSSRRKAAVTSRLRRQDGDVGAAALKEDTADTQVDDVDVDKVLPSDENAGVTSTPTTTLQQGASAVSSTETTPPSNKAEASPARKSNRKRNEPEPEEREPSAEKRSRRETRPPAKFAEERAGAEKATAGTTTGAAAVRGRTLLRDSGEHDSDASNARNVRSVVIAVHSERANDASSSLRYEGESNSMASLRRPTRASKTMSKYYKGPDWRTNTRLSVPLRRSRSRR